MQVRFMSVAALASLVVGCAQEPQPGAANASAPATPPAAVPAPPAAAPRETPREPPATAPTPPPTPGALAFEEAADALHREGYPCAVAKFTEAIALKHRVADAYFQRGLAHFSLRDYERANDDWTQVIQLREKAAVAVYNRGLARYYAGRHTEAAFDFQTVVSDAQLAETARARRVAALEAADHVRRALTEIENAVDALQLSEKALSRGAGSPLEVDRARVRLARARTYLACWAMQREDELKARGEEVAALERICEQTAADNKRGLASDAARDDARAVLAEARIAAARLTREQGVLLAEHRTLVTIAEARVRRAEALARTGNIPPAELREARRTLEREQDRLSGTRDSLPLDRRIDPLRVL